MRFEINISKDVTKIVFEMDGEKPVIVERNDMTGDKSAGLIVMTKEKDNKFTQITPNGNGKELNRRRKEYKIKRTEKCPFCGVMKAKQGFERHKEYCRKKYPGVQIPMKSNAERPLVEVFEGKAIKERKVSDNAFVLRGD
jgi:hypothetical protein